MKTQAAVLRSNSVAFTIEELELEEPRDNEVLVRLVSSGMCHTDVLLREFPAEAFPGPTVFGHEGAGVIEAVGADVTTVAVGDHVVLSFSACGHCLACSKDRPAYCFNFREVNTAAQRLDGSTSLTTSDGERIGSHYFGQSSFSSHAVALESSVVPIDKSYDLARLGPLGCGVMTGAGAVFNLFGLVAGESIVVGGAGSLGLSAVMAAKFLGAEKIIAVDRFDTRLDLAERLGATHVINGADGGLTETILDITGGGSDYALDTTGNAQLLRAMHDGLHALGTLSVAGVGIGDVTFDFYSLLSGRSIVANLMGSSHPREFIPQLAKLNAEGKFPFHELITEFALADINDAEKASASGAAVKPVIRF